MQSKYALLFICCFFISPMILSAQAPDIDVRGGNPYQSITDGDTTPSADDGTDYGVVNVDGGTTEHYFHIFNTGNAELIIESIIDDGPNGADFILPFVLRMPIYVSPGNYTSFRYQFDPSDFGVRTTTLTITSNDPDEGTFDFTLQGTGGGAVIDIRGGSPYQSITDGDNTPSSDDGTDYGNVDVLSGHSIQDYQILNTGVADLIITSIADDGPHHTDFYVVHILRLPIIVEPGSEKYITYRFDPSDNGVRTTTLMFTSNDPYEGTFDFTLQGTGGITEMDVQGNGYSIPDGGGHSTHDGTGFGYVFIGMTATHTFTIENTGTADLQLWGSPTVSVSGTHASDFTVSVQPATQVVSGSGTTTFDIQFQPSTPGFRTASISIVNNDADENPYDIGLDGYGRIEVIFTHGADASLNFMQSPPAPPVNNWPMGQFSLSAGTDAVLNYVVVDLSGTYSGLSGTKPFRIYASDTNDFGTASAKGFDASASGGSVTVEVNDAVSTSTRYYWLTVDLGEGAGGTITGTISDASGIIVYDGDLGSASKYGPLNTEPDVPLPVVLTSFSARSEGRSIVLEWTTESEVNNLGFILERSEDDHESWEEIASYRTHDALKGQGNTSSRTEYTFTDMFVEAGHRYYYRLSDVSIQGEITTYPPIFIHLEDIPKKTLLERAYPNPFNPQTYITYHLAEETQVKITVFDMLGRSVKELYNGRQHAGSYHIYWNSTNENGTIAASGTYMIRMQTDNTIQIQKVLFIK